MEAQRLGLSAYAGDLNPVAVLINKAMIEIPPKFAGQPPVNPEARDKLSSGGKWNGKGADGLAEDVRYYGQWMRQQAQMRIGHLYPPVEVTANMVKDQPLLAPLLGRELTVVAWIWARTVKSSNPAFRDVDVPLASTFILSNKPGREVYVHPVLDGRTYHFTIRSGKPPAEAKHGTKMGRGASFRCLVSNSPIEDRYIKSESLSGRMGAKLMAIVADGPKGRFYLPPTFEQEENAKRASPGWRPRQPLNRDTSDLVSGRGYGFSSWADIFTERQLTTLSTLCDLISEAREKIESDASKISTVNDQRSLEEGGGGARAYSEALCIYLALVVSRVLHYGSTICTWLPKDSAIARTFTKQAIPMSWDFSEGNVFGNSSAGWDQCCKVVAVAMEYLAYARPGIAVMANAATTEAPERKHFVSTDPPYYDNVAYADLSDFFYVWLRRALQPILPELMATMLVPKAEELVAKSYRHGSKKSAEHFFLDGMTSAMRGIARRAHPGAPITIYYAFKQSETMSDEGTASTGWETFLEAVNGAGLSVTGTWPLRTEGDNRQIGLGTNALASSIVLVCRPRPADAPAISRRAFLRELNKVLPEALDEMIRGSGDERSPVAPVDLSQAIIGPGMAVFSKYSTVLEADGTPMRVRTALQLINRFLAEDDFDHDTQFCLHWFEQHGWREGKFGEADTLARAKGTSVEGVKQAGVLYASGGIVRLLKWPEYPSDWDPAGDARLPVWEVLHQLIRLVKTEGEGGAGAMLAAVQGKAEATRQLAYRLYTLCERAGWAEDARAYNEIITSWGAIESAATAAPAPQQGGLFD